MLYEKGMGTRRSRKRDRLSAYFGQLSDKGGVS
jgi:hypothetical protein